LTRLKFYAKGFWVDQNLAQWLTVIMIMVHIGLSMAIVASDQGRFSSPSYEPIYHYVGGHIWVWGFIIFVSAVLMSVPFRWPNIIGLWVGMTWHTIWMSCFTIALIRYDTAVATATPAYGGFAMICTALLTARVIDKSKE
jgi:hypothetical protein